MSNVIRLIFTDVDEAIKCKAEFGADYDMYCGYLSQFNYGGQHLVPVSKSVYMGL